MTALNYTIEFSPKKEWSWKKFSFIKKDNFQIIEKYMDTDYCQYTCSSDDVIRHRIVSEHPTNKEALKHLKKWQVNLTKAV